MLMHYINIYIKSTLVLFLFLGWGGTIYAQEFLTGSRMNTPILKEAKQNKDFFLSSKTNSQPLLLPFFEDFSNYIGFPNERFFIDSQAFVYNTFPVFPPTIGVVTLDALNQYGEIYPHLNAISKGADTLTSRFIRLDSLFVGETGRPITPADSLYFSFYFQPGGTGITDENPGNKIGNQPDINDSLVLEFAYTDDFSATIWEHIWSTPGFNVNVWTSENQYQYFKQVMIPITNEKYLRNNFQFRFRNYASLEPQQGMIGWEGNVDQWHIDYIRLDVGRNINDVFTNDLAFVNPTTSFLQNYQAMPWKQFQPADMKSHFTNYLSNLSNGPRTSTYQYSVSRNGEIVRNYSTGAIDIAPYFSSGTQEKTEQANPPILSFMPNQLTDTALFVVTHVFQNAAGMDFYLGNDTCVFEQKFSDYYAYDDGTAEYGYCLNNQFNIAYLAMKFSLRVPDSLSAVRMWFNHTKNNENEAASFSIVVWKDNNGAPGEKIYTQQNNNPNFSEQFLDFWEYQFDEKVPVSGVFWVGFEQQGNVQLNIGFDQNNDSREFFRYNTRGIWETSAFRGTPMLRAVFGKLNKSTPLIPPKPTTIIGPNPAKNTVLITNYKSQITKIEIFNIVGMKMVESNFNGNSVQMNIANFPAGIYFVKVFTENKKIETIKLIKN